MTVIHREAPLLGDRGSRRAFLATGLAAAAATFVSTRVANAAAPSDSACCPTFAATSMSPAAVPLSVITAGNKRAVDMAQASGHVMDITNRVIEMANSLPDPRIRTATLDVLRTPAPLYQTRSPRQSDRDAVRQELMAAGLISDAVTLDGIFPPVGDPHEPPQAFWSAPGSTYGGHHAFPGGLVTHEWVNASLAAQFVDTYDQAYGLVSESNALDRSIALAAPLWHDINKVTVFQWQDDGSELVEQAIADTGGHHPLSGAEAIVRGMSPDFVVALLSAHDPPQSGTPMVRLINYIRAAAIIARVDPVAFGLLKPWDDPIAPAGLGLAQTPPRVEGHINHLSDHDFVFSGDSSALVVNALKAIAPDFGIDPASDTARFNLFRNTVLAQLSDMRLYGYLQTGGVDAVRRRINADVDVSALMA
ncbi:MAG: hypothetical protein NVSMB2_10710 [Chloroflexota bacterium]